MCEVSVDLEGAVRVDIIKGLFLFWLETLFISLYNYNGSRPCSIEVESRDCWAFFSAPLLLNIVNDVKRKNYKTTFTQGFHGREIISTRSS